MASGVVKLVGLIPRIQRAFKEEMQRGSEKSGLIDLLIRLRHRLGRFLAPPLPLTREVLAAFYLKGSGLEIGALHNRTRVPHDVHVTYVDRYPVAELRRQYPELAGLELAPVDLVDDGRYLTTVSDASQDFVMSYQFIEHCDDPIRTLINHFRVVKVGGIVIVGVPSRSNQFDKERPVTPLEHLYEDFAHGPQRSNAAHYEEWIRVVDKITDEAQISTMVQESIARDVHDHFHVWSYFGFLEFLSSLQARGILDFTLENVAVNAGEAVSTGVLFVVMRKVGEH